MPASKKASLHRKLPSYHHRQHPATTENEEVEAEYPARLIRSLRLVFPILGFFRVLMSAFVGFRVGPVVAESRQCGFQFARRNSDIQSGWVVPPKPKLCGNLERRVVAEACLSRWLSERGPSAIPDFPRAAFGALGTAAAGHFLPLTTGCFRDP
jgi:hypothetical protein